jgi:hypothetical protein
MPQNEELVTKPCGEPGCRGKKRVGLSARCVFYLSCGCPQYSRAFLVIGDNHHAHGHQIS